MEPWKKNLYILWVAQVFSLMGFGFALPFIPFYFQELGVTEPDRLRILVGVSSALPAALMGVMALVWGALSDKIGRKLMILRALLAGALIIGGLGLAKNVETVLVLRAAQGLLTGTMTAAVTLVAAGTPRHRLSYALGLIASSNFIGFSFGPFVGGFTAEFLGYRISFFIGSALLFFAFFLVLYGVKELGVRKHGEKGVPGGSVVPAEQAEPAERKGSAEAAGDGGEGNEGEAFSLKMIFRQPLLLGFILIFFMRFLRALAQPFLPLYFQEMIGRLEGASAITGTVTGLVGLATAAAGITLSRLGDTHDKITLVQIFIFIAAFVSFPLFLVRGLIPFTLFLVVTQFFMGGIEPLLHSILGVHTPPERRGIVFGIQTFIGSMGWFLSPLVGSTISVSLGIRYIFLSSTIGIVLVFFIILFFNHNRKIVRVMRSARRFFSFSRKT